MTIAVPSGEREGLTRTDPHEAAFRDRPWSKPRRNWRSTASDATNECSPTPGNGQVLFTGKPSYRLTALRSTVVGTDGYIKGGCGILSWEEGCETLKRP